MRIRFHYRNTGPERAGKLIGISSGRNSNSLYFLVLEDGEEHPKTFVSLYMEMVHTITEVADVPAAQSATSPLAGIDAEAFRMLSQRVDRLADRIDEVGHTLDITESGLSDVEDDVEALLNKFRAVKEAL